VRNTFARAALALACSLAVSPTMVMAESLPAVTAASSVAQTSFASLGYTMIAHPGSGVKSLTAKQVADIFSGSVTNWNQVGGANLAIVVVTRGNDPSSAAFQTAFAVPVASAKIGHKTGSPAEMLAYVANTNGALSYASNNEANAWTGIDLIESRITDATGIIDLGSITATTLAGAYHADNGDAGSASSVAPSQSSLDATQPQSIITRQYIEESASPVAEFSRIAQIAPSVSINNGTGNGPGLSENKIIIRGMVDDYYNITFDGIPFSDTNDPSHHSTSYFPGLIVGGAEVILGPGHASDMGYGSFGGALKLYSLAPSETPSFEVFAGDGTWGTKLVGANFQSGRQKYLGDGTLQATFQSLNSNGYLANNTVASNNYSLKYERPIGDKNLLDVFSTVNNIHYGAPDAGPGATAAEIAQYGPNVSLNTNPASSEDVAYNQTWKDTDFEYVRLRSLLGNDLKNDELAYTYSYKNWTVATNSVTSPTSSVGTETCALGSVTTLTTNCTLQYNPNDVAGYLKRNQYRAVGDIESLTKKFGDSFVRAGFWWEHSDTNRGQYSVDFTTGAPNYVNGNGIWTGLCQITPGATGATLPNNATSAATTTCGVTSAKGPDQGIMTSGSSAGLPVASVKFDQQSQILTFQPYLEASIVLPGGTTIYPGYKLANITRYDIAAVQNSSRDPNETNRITYNQGLPFFSVNQKIDSNNSVYVQYGKGYEIPDLATFYVYNPLLNSTSPQTSDTYQAGWVGKYHDVTFSADYYTINFQNKLVTETIYDTTPGGSNYTAYVNIGGARYHGWEGEMTFNLGGGFAAYLNGSTDAAINLSTGAQISKVPDMTGALGLLYNSDKLNGALTYKVVGQSFASDLPTNPTAAQQAYYSYYVIPQYGTLDASLTWKVTKADKLQVNLYNILNDQGLASISPGSSSTIGSASDLIVNRAPASLLVTLKHKI
jgi:iron complex outermembrane recepter protein